MTAIDIRSALLTIAAEIERGNHRSAKAKVRALADSLPPATTGAVADLVASLPVVEYMPDGARWLQRRNDRVRVWTDSEWTAAIYPSSVDDDRLPALLVRAEDADADPATRGPIGGGS